MDNEDEESVSSDTPRHTGEGLLFVGDVFDQFTDSVDALGTDREILHRCIELYAPLNWRLQRRTKVTHLILNVCLGWNAGTLRLHPWPAESPVDHGGMQQGPHPLTSVLMAGEDIYGNGQGSEARRPPVVAWVDPSTLPPLADPVGEIMAKITEQYHSIWKDRAKFLKVEKPLVDPTVDDLKGVCRRIGESMRAQRAAQGKAKIGRRIFFHYTGCGAPEPTRQGELFFFRRDPTDLKDLGEWAPLPVASLHQLLSQPHVGDQQPATPSKTLPSPLSVNINVPLTAIQNVYLLDCHYAGRVIEALDQCHGPQAILVTPTAAPGSTLWGGRIRRPSADGLLTGGGDMSSTCGTPLAATRTSPVEEGSYYAFGACGSDQRLTVHERTPFPVDYFTSCMTSPVRAALAFYAAKGNRLTSHIDAKLLDDIPGRIDQRNTPLGELQWILTSITEAIAWNTFDLALFQQLHRTDPAIATLFRNFLVANRILRSLGLTPVSRPVLPDTHLHPLWDVWDAVAEHVVLQLPTLMQHPETAEANYRPSAFYEQQMLAFSVWLRGSDRDDTTTPHHHLPPFSQHMINQPVAASAAGLTPMRRPSVSDQQPGFDMGGLAESAFAHQLLAPPPRPPEQLPILLQSLLRQRGRAETLRLMTVYLDMGPWAVRCALIVGLVPYLTQLLSRPAVPTDVRELIILLWSKFLAYDPSCRKEVLQAGLHRHFINYIAEGRSPVHRAFACICIAILCRDYPLPESDDDVPTARGAQLVVVNEGGLQACAAVLSHRADPLAFLRRSAALAMAEMCRNFPEAQERVLASGWHTRLLEGLDDHRPEVRACFVCAVASLLYPLLDPQYQYQCEREMQESAMDVRNAPVGSIGWAPGLPQQPPASGAMAATGSPPFSAVSIPSPKDATALPSAVLQTPPGLRASAAPQQVMRAISGRPPVMRNSSSGDSTTTGQQTPLSTPMANQRGGHGNQLMPPDSSDSLRRQGSGGSTAAFARSRSDHNQPPVGLSGGQGPSAGPGAGMGRARSGTGDFLQDNPSLKSMTLLGVRLEKAPPLRLMSPAPGGRTVSSEWVGADGGDTPTLSPMETRSHSIAGQTFGSAVVDADSHARDMAAALRWREELVERMCGHFLCSGIGSPPPSPSFGLDAGRDDAATTFVSSPENDILRESSLLVKHELVCALAPIMWESWCEAHSTALRTPRALVRPGAVGPLTDSVTTAAGKSGGSDETVSAASSVATSHSSVLSAGPPAIVTDADTPPVGPMASPTHTSVPYSLRSRVMVLLWRDGSTLISHMCRRSVVAAQMVIARQKQEQAAEALQRMAAQPGAEDADSDESEPSNYARALSPEFPSPTAAPPMQRTPPLSSRLPPRVAETLEGIDEAVLPPLSASAKDWCFGCRHHMPHHRSTFHTHSAGALASSGCVAAGRVGGVHRAQRHSFMGAVGIAEEGESTESEGNTPKSDSKKAAKPSGGFSTFLKSLQSMMLPKHMRVATTTPLHDQLSSLGWSHIDRSASLSLDPTTFTIDRSPVGGSEGGHRCALPRPSSARLLVPQQTIGGGMGRGAGPPRLTSRPSAPLLRRNSRSEGDFESGGGPQARTDEAVADEMGLDEEGNCTLPASQVFQWTIALLLRPRTFSHPLFKIYGSPPHCSSHHLAASADDGKSPKSGQRRGVHCHHHHHHHHHHRRLPQGDSSPRAAGGEQPSVVVKEPPAVHHRAPPRLFQPVPEPCHVSRCSTCMFHQVGLRKGDKTPHYCRGLFPPTSCEYVLLPTPPAEPFGQQPRKPRGSPMIKRASREREPTSASAATLKVERVAESSKTLPGPPGSREWRRAQSSSPQARPLEPRPLAVVMPSPAAKHAAAPSPIPLPPRQVSPLPGDLRASRDIDVTEVRPISLPTAAPHSSGGGASSSLSQPAPSFPSSQRLSSHENSDSESSSSSSSGSSVVHFFRVAVCGQCFADEIPAGGDYVEHSSVPLPGIDMEVSGARKGVVGAGALLDWLGVTHHPTCLLFHPSRPLLLVGQALGTLQVFDYSSSPAVCRRVVNVFATHKGSARSGCPWHLEPQAGAQQTGPLRLARSSAQGPPSLLTYVSLYPPRILQRLGDDMRAVSGSPQSMKQQRSPSLIPAALTRSFSAQHTVMAATASPLAGSFVSATGSPPVYGSVAGTNPPPMGLPPQAQMGPDGRRDSLAEQFDALKGDRRQLGMNSQAMFGPGELPGYPDWGNQGGLAIGHPYGCKTCGAAHPSFTDLAFVNEHAHLPPPQDDIACQVIGGFDDGTVRLCRFWTDTANHQKPLVVATWQALPPKRQTGLRLSFRQRSGRLVAGGRDPLVRVWDVRQGRCVGSFPHGGAASSHVTCLHQPVGDPDAPIDSLTPSQPLSAFHPDIATGNSDGSVTLIDSRADGSRARGAGRDPLLYHRSAILTMSAGIPGQPFQLITADTSASVALWDIRKKNTVLRAYQLGTVSKGPPAAPNLTPPTPSLTGRELSPRSMLPPLASSTADSLTAGPSSTSTASHAVLSADIHPFHSSIGWSGSKGDMVISSSVGGDTLQRWTLRRKMRGTTVKWHPVKAVMGVVGEGGGPGGGALVYRAAKEKISPDR